MDLPYQGWCYVYILLSITCKSADSEKIVSLELRGCNSPFDDITGQQEINVVLSSQLTISSCVGSQLI